MNATSPIRVAVLTQQVSPYHAARYKAARASFAELRVFSAMNSADFKEFLSHTTEPSDIVRLFEGEASYGRAIFSGGLWSRLHARLDDFKPQVVVVAGWSFSESLAAIAWARTSGARAAIMSESQFRDAARTNWREAIKRRVVSACDSALVAAAPHREYAASLGIPAERVFLGYDAVDNSYFEIGSDKARAHASTLRRTHCLPYRYLLASGRFLAKKNFPRLIEAFAHALRKGDTGHDLLILGNGDERVAIEHAARQHGIRHRLRLPGFRPYDMLPMFYGLADGFVHPALAEQWGLVVNEAAASALPLVVSRPTGAAAALVRPGENGLLVEPTDIEDIAQSLHMVMSMPDEERRAMGAASRRIVTPWGPQRYADGLRAACNAALECPPRQLGTVDRVLFRMLSHLRINKVR